MQNVFTDYPEIPWKQGWKFASGPEDTTPLITGSVSGVLTAPGSGWTLRLIAPKVSCTTRLFSNGFSISGRKHPERSRIDALVTGPGLLCGRVSGLPMPQLTASAEIHTGEHCVWVKDGSTVVLLLQQENRFVLICNEHSPERALVRAETAFDENFDTYLQDETAKRQNTASLFGVDSRHNAPVALASEILRTRLRRSTGAIHGLWSLAEGFSIDTFSLNELYPLTRAWALMDPDTAVELVKTALSLQQSNGGLPIWINTSGQASFAAPWPLIVRSFEVAWTSSQDMAFLNRYLPALRKYIQWALHYFTPHHDGIPAWQSEQEVFIPGSFERDKATPDLTSMLINEINALLRLAEKSTYHEPAIEQLRSERDRLTTVLATIFWNPGTKSFSNVWKNGHFIDEPTFGSLLPVVLQNMDSTKMMALEENRGVIELSENSGWNQNSLNNHSAEHAIQQLVLVSALRFASAENLALLKMAARNIRNDYTDWFERESSDSAQSETNGISVYSLDPVAASVILATQEQLEYEERQMPAAVQQIRRWGHRLRINKTDLRIIAVFLFAIVIIHLAYTLPHHRDVDPRVAEAALNYRQGHYRDALRICRRYPDNALCQFLQANLMMLAEQPDRAEEMYRKALIQNTESPSALFGLALALQMNGNFTQAEKRYNDFIDIHEQRHPEAAALADEFLQLAREKFSKPPRWKRVYAMPMMNDLGL